MNPEVDKYLARAKIWQAEMQLLQELLLECGLTEALKWSKPCYSFEGKNIAIIQGFKSYLAILFFKGVLLSDPEKILVKTGENTQVGRQIRFKNVQQVNDLKSVVKSYVFEAIAIEKAGLEPELPKPKDLLLPKELLEAFAAHPSLKQAFTALTPGRQRAYHIYFSSAKQPQTRRSRIEKCMPDIMSGKGLNDL